MPEVLAIREIKLRPQTNEIVFLNYYNKWCKNIKAFTKGVNAWIMKGDRGIRQDDYNMVWGFNYVETRDYYFPVSDINNYPKWNAALERFQFRAPSDPLIEDMTDYTDFIIIGYDEMINPQMGEVVSISYPKVKPGSEKEFENFVSKTLNNSFQNNVDGYYLYILKGDRGKMKDQYAILQVFDTYERRNLYFPNDTSVPSATFTKANKKINGLMKELQSYLEDGAMDQTTDYVVIY